jgi:hypothetical protein
MTTLSNGSTTLTLDDDLLWADEFAWQPVARSVQTTVTGAVLVESAVRQAGRPITLRGGTDYGWMTRADVLALRAWAALPAATFTLTLRGQAYTVAFADAGVDATPVIDVSDPTGGDYYIATVSLIEV